MTPAVVEIMEIEAERHGLTLDAALNRRATAHVRAPVYALLSTMGWSYSRIAREFERHHTTIMYAMGAI